MSAKAMTKAEGRAPRRRPGPGKTPAAAAADEMTDDQLYALLDARLTELSHRVQAGLVRTERLLKRLA